MSGVFLWFNFICYRINKFNNEHLSISKRLKIIGTTIFAFNILNVLGILFILVAAIHDYSITISNTDGRIAPLLIPLFALLLVCLSAIINLVFYIRTLRKNKALVNDLINEIGVI
jgi:phosphoglycerol transferase MdoB-like AlkP superfamily enzyme